MNYFKTLRYLDYPNFVNTTFPEVEIHQCLCSIDILVNIFTIIAMPSSVKIYKILS